MRASIILAAALALVANPALSQGRGPPEPKPVQTPSLPAGSPHAFKAPPGSTLILRNGRPKWEVYNDCSWAFYDAAQVLFARYKRVDEDAKAMQAEAEAAEASSRNDASSASILGWSPQLGALNARSEAEKLFDEALAIKRKSETLNDLAVDAYAAQTGTTPSEATRKAVVGAKAVASLTTDACEILLPSG